MFDLDYTLIIQGCVVAIIIGIFYNLWISTKVYGGIIGSALRFLGVGLLFFTIAVLEKSLANFSVLPMTGSLSMLQDVLNLFGLGFSALGFSKLASVAKQ